jgi:hypothetical protein
MVANYPWHVSMHYPGLFFFIYLQDVLVYSPIVSYLDHRFLDKKSCRWGTVSLSRNSYTYPNGEVGVVDKARCISSSEHPTRVGIFKATLMIRNMYVDYPKMEPCLGVGLNTLSRCTKLA